jgi:hypothetical protein
MKPGGRTGLAAAAERGHHHERLAIFGDDEGLAVGCLSDQLRELSPGLLDVGVFIRSLSVSGIDPLQGSS